MGEPEHDRQEHTQTVIDLRRAIDLVTAQPEVDTHRVGYVGHSFGALFGGILAGVEKRIKAFVLMAGVGGFTAPFAQAGPMVLYLKTVHDGG